LSIRFTWLRHEDALARAFEGEEWKAWMTKNDVAAPPLRGPALQKYLETQYTHTGGVLVDLGLAAKLDRPVHFDTGCPPKRRYSIRGHT
jgi:hypothetical protein